MFPPKNDVREKGESSPYTYRGGEGRLFLCPKGRAMEVIDMASKSRYHSREGLMLRIRRMQVGLRQIDLARAIGRCQSWLSYVECGRILPQAEETKRIIETLNRAARTTAEGMRNGT